MPTIFRIYRRSIAASLPGIALVLSSAEAQVRRPIELPPVAVTATRLDTGQAGTRPLQGTTIISGEELQRRGVASVSDVLRMVPGASVVQSGSTGGDAALFLRGGERDFVLFLVDGVPINEPGGFINLAFLSLENVERVEIVRGPGSVLYGSDAISGVVQIFTRRGSSGRSAEVAGTYGTDGIRSTELQLSAASGRSSYSLGYSRASEDGIYDLNHHMRNTGYSGTLSGALSSATTYRVTGRVTDGSYNYPTTFYGEPLDSNSYNSERRLSTGLALTSRLSESVESVLEGSYTRLRFVYADPEDELTPFPYDSRSRSERRNAGLRFNIHPNRNAVITTGADYEAQNSAVTGGADPASNPLLERWNRAVFAQLLAHSERRADIQLGVRLDDNQRFGRFFTWRGALALAVWEGGRVRALWGTGFREPQFNEITGGGFAKPSPDLLPEESRSSEYSFEQSFASGKVVMSATLFKQLFTGLIQYAPLQGDPDYFNQYQNVDRATADGWEFEFDYTVSASVGLRSSYTIVDSRIRGDTPAAGEHLPRRPSGFGSAGVRYLTRGGFSVDADMQYVGRRSDTRFFADFSSQRERLPGYAQLDLAASYKLSPAGSNQFPMLLNVRVTNALNREIESVAGFPIPGRRVVAGARLLMNY